MQTARCVFFMNGIGVWLPACAAGVDFCVRANGVGARDVCKSDSVQEDGDGA